LYNDGKLDMNDIQGLNNLRDNIKDQYLRGKYKQRTIWQISRLDINILQRNFHKELDSLNSMPENGKGKKLSSIVCDIEDMQALLVQC
jgi:hypothetical protein